MKKVLLLGLTVVAFSAVSCKKDWTCKCTWSDGTNSGTTSSTIENSTKSDAETACNANDGSINNQSWDCELQ